MFDILVTFFVNNPHLVSGWVFSLLITVLAAVTIACVFAFERAPAQFVYGVVVLVLVVTLISAFLTAEGEVSAQAEAAQHHTWVAARCPVYKSECGGKHKYVCERRGAVVGRNQVGLIFVEAYPTC